MTTASLMRGSNDTYGLQNRTYIVTTILVSRYEADMFGTVAKNRNDLLKDLLIFVDKASKSLDPLKYLSVIISPCIPFNYLLLTSVSLTSAGQSESETGLSNPCWSNIFRSQKTALSRANLITLLGIKILLLACNSIRPKEGIGVLCMLHSFHPGL